MIMFFDKINQMVNTLLRRDPVVWQQLCAQANVLLALEITDLALHLQIKITESGLLIEQRGSSSADIELSGNSIALWQMLRQEHAILPEGVSLSGDVMRARHIQELVRDMDIDWAGILTPRCVGWLAQDVGDGIAQGKEWLQQVLKDRGQDVVEFSQEEYALAPSAAEVRRFCDEVDRLRDDVARLQAQWRRIQNTSPSCARREA